jgi:hypothetical protein
MNAPENLSAERLANARSARDDALRIIRAVGHWQGAGPIKVLFADIANFKIAHRTPFSDRQRTERAARTYDHALAKQRTKPGLPYSIEVWFERARVFFPQWDTGGELQVVSFSPGRWQEELPRLVPKGDA